MRSYNPLLCGSVFVIISPSFSIFHIRWLQQRLVFEFEECHVPLLEALPGRLRTNVRAGLLQNHVHRNLFLGVRLFHHGADQLHNLISILRFELDGGTFRGFAAARRQNRIDRVGAATGDPLYRRP